MIKASFAGLNFLIENRYPYLESIASDYLRDFDRPDVTVSVTDSDLDAEREFTEGNFLPPYLESSAVYRKIAEKISEFSAAVFHGAVIAVDGAAYAVTARSGVGKTTHLSLWLKEFPDVHILNGDKPILRNIDGVIYAAGTPWRGKEGYGVNEMLPLKGIAFLERAEENSAERITPNAAVLPLVSQVYMPRSIGAGAVLSLINKIVLTVPTYKLKVNMDPEAARVARRAFCEKNI